MSLRALKGTLSHESTIAAQRRVATWLDAVRARGRAEGTLPVRVAGLDVDPLGCLRSVLLMRGALAFRQLETLRALAAQHTAPVRVDDDAEVVRLVDVAGAVGAQVVRQDLVPKEALRRTAYRLRRGVLQRKQALFPRGVEGPVDVVVFPRLLMHLEDLAPVVRALVERTAWRPLVVVVEPRVGEAAAAVIDAPVRPLLSYRHPLAAELEAATGVARTLLAIADEQVVAPEVSAEEARALRYVASATMRAHMGETVRMVHGIADALRTHKPKLVFVGNPYTYEGRVVGSVAAALGVKTASIEHGSIFPDAPQWAEAPVDRMLVWGEASAEALRASAFPPTRIVVTGSPRLDAALQSAPPAQERTHVLVATSGAGDLVSAAEHAQFIVCLKEAAGADASVQWHVRLHPKDKMADYTAAALPENVKVTEASGESIYAALGRARALVTILSTTAVEAMVCGVPVVVVRLAKSSNAAFARVEYLSPERTVHATDAQELLLAVRAILAGPPDAARAAAARAYAARHFAFRGEAAAHAAGALVDLVGAA